MSGFVEGIDRSQSSLFPAELEDYVAEDNLVRAVDAFVDGLDLGKLGFGRVAPLERGRPCYHPATLLKIYIYGYLNQVPSSRRLERECQRNIELIWLTGHLAPDFKTIADFRKDNGKAIGEVCRSFVAVCRDLDLLSEASVAIDGSKFRPSDLGRGRGQHDRRRHAGAQFPAPHRHPEKIGAEHAYGAACYQPGRCAEIIARTAQQIDAHAFNPRFPTVFPRFVQHAIWRYCAQQGRDICNGNRIDDGLPCDNVYCQIRSRCDRIALNKSQ